MRMRVAILEIRHPQQLCSSKPKNENWFFPNFFAESVSWGSQESVEPMRVFNGPSMRMRVSFEFSRYLQAFVQYWQPKKYFEHWHVGLKSCSIRACHSVLIFMIKILCGLKMHFLMARTPLPSQIFSEIFPRKVQFTRLHWDRNEKMQAKKM